MEVPGYKIQREIGRGGMATVYLAIQESLGRPVVLKMLNSVNLGKSEELVDRFLAEGRILASLNHPNIITIYDIGLAGGSMYISMEYVHGGDLKQRLELSISPAEALDYLAQVTRALGEAHKHGIVHRDVKPANILFKDNTPILTDFGIAKYVDTDSDLTSTGVFLGSPNYVSPEQASGTKLDGRADIYSLGCIFYEMLAGKKPYTSDSVIDIIIKHRQAPIPKLPKELAEYQPLLNRMMAKKRDERFPDAESLLTEIDKLRRQHLKGATGEIEITGEQARLLLQTQETRKRRILIGLILISLVVFSTLKYVEIRIKAPSTVNTRDISTETILDTTTGPVVTAMTQPAPTQNSAAPAPDVTQDPLIAAPAPDPVPPPAPAPPVNAEIVKALKFLGQQSLDAYKLTYPPGDNAYYYFSRLLELEPGSPEGVNGILQIADRYAFLAEQAVLNNENEKASAYADIGLRINPRNEALLALKNFSQAQDGSLWTTVKKLFSGK